MEVWKAVDGFSLYEVSNSAKLSDRDVKSIRKMLQQGMLHREIADMFSVSRDTITKINLGLTYLVARKEKTNGKNKC